MQIVVNVAAVYEREGEGVIHTVSQYCLEVEVVLGVDSNSFVGQACRVHFEGYR